MDSPCGVIRPGTLGYQRCQKDPGHDLPHRSQDGHEWDPIAGLSPRMLEALRCLLPGRPDSIHEHDRDPWRWLRMEPKPTVQALARRGLVDEWWPERTSEGYRARLTDAGVAARAEARRPTGEGLGS